MGVVSLREAVLEDKPDRLKVTQAAWVDAYNAFMPVELMESLWNGDVDETSTYADAREGNTDRWVVELNGDIVGHVGLVTRREGNGLVGEISPLYVHPRAQGMGIGRQLLSRVESAAQAREFDSLWVFALEQGPAIAFYLRHGFAFRRQESLWIADRLFPVAALCKQFKENSAE